jgi:hypothetical protein
MTKPSLSLGSSPLIPIVLVRVAVDGCVADAVRDYGEALLVVPIFEMSV